MKFLFYILIATVLMSLSIHSKAQTTEKELVEWAKKVDQERQAEIVDRLDRSAKGLPQYKSNVGKEAAEIFIAAVKISIVALIIWIIWSYSNSIISKNSDKAEKAKLEEKKAQIHKHLKDSSKNKPEEEYKSKLSSKELKRISKLEENQNKEHTIKKNKLNEIIEKIPNMTLDEISAYTGFSKRGVQVWLDSSGLECKDYSCWQDALKKH